MDKDETRAFFAARATTWDDTFPDDGPAFAAAVARLELRPGLVALDAGCGTGRAMPLLRDHTDRVVGVDLTPEMARKASERGPVLIGDAFRLPFADATIGGILAAGLIGHLGDPRGTLLEFARVARAGARLALFHPVGRAVLAARRGRELSPDDIRAEHRITPLLRATGWEPVHFHDEDDHYLAVARRGA
ncbi:class I SAM-dependent methyltransferase [Herbidospora galbida]|uniref:Class I SAM-dependent methyltransferase n=1 Tax=Herbidospora galbida TaxID=2575442 RepID=A0A4U3MDM6_9ACTN|nr:class I SAM-dependent methyltransferase [Herbidospora galbida]TKK86284.1 class I SAM-dependent methyltransferase [Herbidospora galbida]